MELDEIQRDALAEVINMAFGRAASALSKLTGYRVQMQAPRVTICPAADLVATLGAVMPNDVATVHQIFSGPVAGDALLILDGGAASRLKELLTDEPPLPLAVDRSGHEVLAEVGNILLNACLGTISNLLDVHVTFSVPKLTLASLEAMLQSLLIGRSGVHYAIVAHAGFHLRESEVDGYMVIVLTVASLDRLLSSVGGGVGA